jgi:hypothetical protein
VRAAAVVVATCLVGTVAVSTPLVRADVASSIAEDEGTLMRSGGKSTSTTQFALYRLLDALWRERRYTELARVLSTADTLIAGATRAGADAPLFAGNRLAGFIAYPTDWSSASQDPGLLQLRRLAKASAWHRLVLSARTVHDHDYPTGFSITAALLEGDAYAACGAFAAARTTWYRAYRTTVPQLPDTSHFFPEWISAMRRLSHYRTTRERPTSSAACRRLPQAIASPDAILERQREAAS